MMKSTSSTIDGRSRPTPKGVAVAIGVGSVTRAIGDTVITARHHLRSKHPAALDIWLIRAGHRALHLFGGRPLRNPVSNLNQRCQPPWVGAIATRRELKIDGL